MTNNLSKLVACLLLAAGAFAAGSPEIRVGSELDFRPYCFTDADGRPTGFGVELIRAVADNMGLRLCIVPGPWERVWSDLVDGNLDVLPIVARTPGREPLVDFGLPHTETFDAFFVQRGRPPIPNLAAATGKRIVVLREDAAHHQLIERGFGDAVIPVESIADGLRLVAAGRHDALLCSKLIATLEMRQHGVRGVEAGPPIPDYKRVFSFAVRKGNTELLEKLNQGLLIVKTDGEYEDIYRRWLAVDEPWRRWLPYFRWVVGALVALAAVVLALQWLVRRRTRELVRAQAELRAINANLEARVAERTAALRESEARIQHALSASRSFTFEWHPATDEVRRSDSCGAVLGLAGDEAVHDTGQRYFESVHPDDRARFVHLVSTLAPTCPHYATEYRVARGDGSSVTLEEVGQADFDDAGKLVRLVGASTDITARKQAEETLRTQAGQLERSRRAAMNLAADATAARRRAEQAAAALRESMAELERFNERMVGRELRMVELKQEVNALCARFGQPAVYPAGLVNELAALDFGKNT